MKFFYKIPGPVLVVLGAFFLSYGGLLIKSFEGASLWQILLWRSIFCFLTIGIFLLATYKKEIVKKLISNNYKSNIFEILQFENHLILFLKTHLYLY